jgi:hypothetical protein
LLTPIMTLTGINMHLQRWSMEYSIDILYFQYK